MNSPMITAEKAAAPRHRYPTPGNPLAANNTPPRAAPPTPPDWLLKPIIPTPVARDWPEIYVVNVISTGQPTLMSAIAPVAMATAAQTETSTESNSKAAAPPARVNAAIKGILSFRPATGAPI